MINPYNIPITIIEQNNFADYVDSWSRDVLFATPIHRYHQDLQKVKIKLENNFNDFLKNFAQLAW